MACNRTGNMNPGRNQQPGSARSDLNKSCDEKDEDMKQLFEALGVIKRIQTEEIDPLLLKYATATATNELYGQERKAKYAEGRDWQMEYRKLEIRHHELQQKFDKREYGLENEHQKKVTTKTTVEIENEKPKSKIKEAEQELSEQRREISRLKKHVELMDEEATSLKALLHEKDMQLLKQKQGRNWNVEHEQLEMRHKDLQKMFDKIKDESQAMVMDKTKLENEIETLRSKLRKTEQEFLEKANEMSRLKKHVELVDEESKSLKALLHEKDMQLLKQKQGRNWKKQVELRHHDLQTKYDKIKYESQAMVMDKTKLENENEKLRSMLRKTDQLFSDHKNEISIKKHVESVDEESKSLKAHRQVKKRQLLVQIEAMNKAYAEKDEAYTRLCNHAELQMSVWNPNITDLSEQNRPSKLGERYSELYDNEWTNAFEVLLDMFHMDDKGAHKVLQTILLESYKSAFDVSRSQMEEAEYKLSGSSKGVGSECKRLLKEARKHIDIKQADSLLKNVLEGTLTKAIETKCLTETPVRVFAKECFQLCWLMSIQDPPVVLAKDSVQGSLFDTNMYKYWTNSGDTMDYVVWPALLLHKDGPLLTKGVAQPFPRFRPKSAFPLGENKKTDNETLE